jgi:hypothetical protein
MFESRMLRRTSTLKSDERIGGWRNLHNEELHNFHSSPKSIGMIRSSWVKACGARGSEEDYLQGFRMTT